jgi:Flp pilus assembly protein CpaB
VLAWRWRLPIGVLVLALAAQVTVHQLRPEPPGTVRIVVSARALTAGSTLTRADLADLDVPADAAPAGARADLTSLIGRSTALDLPMGVPLVPELLGGALHGPPGTVVTVVPLDGPGTTALAGPGDRVDVVATVDGGGPGSVVAHRALVLPTVGRASTGSDGVLCPADHASQTAETLVLAVSTEEALALSGASRSGGLVALLVP